MLGALALSVLVAAPTATGAPPTQGGGGGAEYVAVPKVAKVTCVRDCASRGRAKPGSVLRLRGSDLAGRAPGDLPRQLRQGRQRREPGRPRARDRAARAGAHGGGERGARRGHGRRHALGAHPPRRDPAGAAARAGRGAHPRARSAGPGCAGPRDRHQPHQGLRRGAPRGHVLVPALRRRAERAHRRAGARLRRRGGQVVVAAGRRCRARCRASSWDGRIGTAAAKPGRYSFRLTAASADGAEARSSQAGDVQRDAFDLYDHIFPVRGKHDFGGAGASFGSGRAGHSHQGHDVFAACGVPMVAARGGQVQYSGYHAAAGNYLVIDGAGSDYDYAYMHLAEPSAVPLRRPRLHRPAHRRGRRDRQRPGLPPALRALGRARVVRGRAAVRPAARAARLGQLVLTRCTSTP